MRVGIFSTKKFEQEYFNRLNIPQHELLFFEQALTKNSYLKAKDCEAIAIFSNDDCSEAVLNLLHTSTQVKYIATRSAGTDHINLSVAAALGFRVASVPQYSPYAIAEHVIALILALNRKLIIANEQVKNYNFLLDNLIGFDLHGKTVGIIGLGRIGAIVAKIMHGFGCNIIGFDILVNETLQQNYDINYTTLAQLYAESDIICIQTPLNEHTKYLINKTAIAQMKTGVMLINTSRGGVLNTEDVIEGLSSGKIGAAGLDVYEKEKGLFFFDHSNEIQQDKMFAQLLNFKNVLITGHQAFLTSNALDNIIGDTIAHITDWELYKKASDELF
jgi:D-lactate dehydrogenase